MSVISATDVDPKRCTPDILKNLAEPFFEQGETRVFLALCCGRVLLGSKEVTRCSICKERPKNHECSSVAEVVAFADP